MKWVNRHECSVPVDNLEETHCVKSVRIWTFSGPYFPAFGLNTERYEVSFRIQSKCGKMRAKKTPNMDTFHVETLAVFFFSC